MPRSHVPAALYSKNLGRQWSGLKVGVIAVIFVAGVVAAGARALAGDPSFDCKKARGIIEQAICDFPQLAATDRDLAREYQEALAEKGADQTAIRATQKQWLRQRKALCADRAEMQSTGDAYGCLLGLYQWRLSILKRRHQDVSVCQSIAATLPPKGGRLPANRLADIISAEPGSPLRMTSAGGLSLESTYGGSLNCQRNTLYRETSGGREQIDMPGYFAGGEGALCGDDKVRLATIGDAPALLDEYSDGNRSVINLTLLVNEKWTPACELTVEKEPHYGILEQFCDGDECNDLSKLALNLADARHGLDHPPIGSDLSEQQQGTWLRMQFLAKQQELEGDLMPTFGADPWNNHGPCYYYSYVESTVMPVVVNGRLLLGKIGLARRSLSHSGSAELFSAYRLSQDRLEPAAGFYMDVVGGSLLDVQVTPAP